MILAEDYLDRQGKPKYNIIGWYASEKYDGERAYWNGSQLLSRAGNRITTPLWFDELLSGTDEHLDGELWVGRGNFHLTGNFRAKVSDEALWKNRVEYVVFDAPSVTGTLTERLEKLSNIVENLHKKWEERGSGSARFPIKLIEYVTVTSLQMLQEYFNTIVKEGGEGVILRKPDSPYIRDRTNFMLKYRLFRDGEAVIIGYTEGHGKNAGKLGCFRVNPLKPDGTVDRHTEFGVSGMNDSIRSNYLTTHPIGTVITYTYTNTTATGKPRPASYKCIRRA